MMTALEPIDEAARLATLQSLRVLDTDAEPVFDGLVQRASQLTGSTFTLVLPLDGDDARAPVIDPPIATLR